MNLVILGAKTLERFTYAIGHAFSQHGLCVKYSLEALDNADFVLIQIHGSPKSLEEDLQILNSSYQFVNKNLAFLIHRPDELLLHSDLIEKYVQTKKRFTIFFGDHLLNRAPYSQEISKKHIIPHPYFNLNFPNSNHKIICGSYTSWGEMRDPGHFLQLISSIQRKNGSQYIQAKIGGTWNESKITPASIQGILKNLELDLTVGTSNQENADILVEDDFFIPHFNTQMYHLNGCKRYGESSGSLHTGITIPIIFEANGIEHTEGIKVIKINADDDLKNIDFESAAEKILRLTRKPKNLDEILLANYNLAKLNTVDDFASKALSAWSYQYT